MKQYLNSTIVRLFFFGIASGFPWVLIGTLLTLWLQEAGLGRSQIGYAGAIFAVYSINFIWSPLVDRFNSPLGLKFGRRKSWIVLMQLIIATCCIVMGYMDAVSGAGAVIAVCIVIALASATQDIAIDAYRIDVIDSENREQIAIAASSAIAGWHTGFYGLGAFMLYAQASLGWGWPLVYQMSVLVYVPLLIIVATATAVPKVLHTNTINSPSSSGTLFSEVKETVIEPLADFFARYGKQTALTVIAFVICFKLGEAFLGRMSLVFYKEIGFTNEQIATYSKLVSWGVTIFFSLLSGWMTARFGLVKGLFIAGIAMASSNLLFSAIATIGPQTWLFATTMIVDGFTSAWSNVAFVAFLSMLCSQRFSATQYALLASLGTLGRTVLGSTSGQIVDALNGNWALFFMLTALAVIPALALLSMVKKRLLNNDAI